MVATQRTVYALAAAAVRCSPSIERVADVVFPRAQAARQEDRPGQADIIMAATVTARPTRSIWRSRARLFEVQGMQDYQQEVLIWLGTPLRRR